MDMKEIKKRIRLEISNSLGSGKTFDVGFIREKAQRVFRNLRPSESAIFDKLSKEKIIELLCKDFLGFGPLQPLMEDAAVTEIMVNGPSEIYIEKHGKKTLYDEKFDDEHHLRYIVEKMIRDTGRRVDESYPYVDFSLADGCRVNVIIPPLAVGGTKITVRKFLRSIATIEDLVKLGTLDSKMADFLVACIKAKINILFSGATGSGKTTTVEVLSSYIEPRERIITIEDALELTLRQRHVVRLLTKPPSLEGRGEITLGDLFRNTLRMRPNRIILGEIRGEEAMDYLQALNSGHRGCLAVLHAFTPSETMLRLETMALYAGLNLPTWAIRQQISSGLELIVQHEQLLDGSRKITYITEVGDIRDGQIALRDIFRFEPDEIDEKNRTVKGHFQTIERPSFLPAFKKKGISLDDNLFRNEVQR